MTQSIPLEFYTFVPQFGQRNASPFCLKLETYLALAGVEHARHEIMDPRQAPKEKMPYIVHGASEMGDSELIINYLKSKFGDPLGDGLTDAQKAKSHALNVMLAERFYWAAMIYPRWIEGKHFDLLTETWFGMIPGFLRGIITKKIFKDIAKGAKAHGIGKHSESEIYALGLSDLKALEAQLGDKDFLLDEKPREIDASAYAFLSGTNSEIFPTPLSAYIQSRPKLLAYIDRVEMAAFGSLWTG